MNLITVVLAGHSQTKIENLKKLYEKNKPSIEHKLYVIYNGYNIYSMANITVENNNRLRDIGMYWSAIHNTNSNNYFFLNDDVVYIKDNKWLNEAIEKLEKAEIVGVQSNLSSLFNINIIKKVTNNRYPMKWEKWGREPMFIRTSNFACNREYFCRLFNKSNQSAQVFEKQTIAEAKSWDLFDDKFHICDTNLFKYKDYFYETTKHI